MQNLDKQYKELVQNIFDNGSISGDRTGTGTIKIFGNMFKHNMSDGFPLLTSKKIFWKGILHELLWFLKGDTNIKYLVDNNVNIWVGDCYKKYITLCSANTSKYDWCMRDNQDGTVSMYTEKEFIEQIKINDKFSKEWGELNKVYGAEWIDWYGINQIQELINTLKENPNSRRMLVTAWNPVNVKLATLPPCHYCFQIITKELTIEERNEWFINNWGGNKNDWKDYELDQQNVPKYYISLMFNMRSVDVALGLPFDIASYAFLLSMIAQCVNMIPSELICSSADTHIYLNQFEGLKQQLNNPEYDLPKLILDNKIDNIFDFTINSFKIDNYQSCDKIFIPLSN